MTVDMGYSVVRAAAKLIYGVDGYVSPVVRRRGTSSLSWTVANDHDGGPTPEMEELAPRFGVSPRYTVVSIFFTFVVLFNCCAVLPSRLAR